jgi:hypothetical protein
MQLSEIEEIKRFFLPIEHVQIGSGMKVTYYWEISLAKHTDSYFGLAEERAFGRTLNWADLNVRDEASALLVMRNKCEYNTK